MAENQVQDSLQKTKETYNEFVKFKKFPYDLNAKTEDLWVTISNSGALSDVTVSLPNAVIGDGYRFNVDTAYAIGIKPQDIDTIENPATGAQGSAGVPIYSETVGSRIIIECTTDNEWAIKTKTGTWAATGNVFYNALSFLKMGH